MSDYISKQEAIQKVTEVELQDGTFADAKIKIGAIKTLNEKEITRKPMERIIERLEERKSHLMKEFVLTNKARNVKADALSRINELDVIIEIVKEECGINE